MDEKPGRLDSFNKFLKSVDRHRRHFAWQAGDIERLPSRVDHLAWTRGDIQVRPPPQIKDTLGEELQEYSFLPHHLQNMPKMSHPLEDMTHLHPDDMAAQHAHRLTFNEGHHATHNEYKGHSFDINQPLRDGHLSADNSGLSKGMHDASVRDMDHITGQSLNHDLIVHRGLGHKFPIHDMEPGSEFRDNAYTGTSLKPSIAIHAGFPIIGKGQYADGGGMFRPNHYVDPDHPLANHFSVARIHLPAGIKGHYMDHPDFNTGLQHEHEFTLHRGTKFRVIGHSTNSHGLASQPDLGKLPGLWPRLPNTKIHIVHMKAIDQ